jgi:uncharacterized protein YrzB (UPF0473 family)
MGQDETKDYITIEDEQGSEKQFAVEALFEMEEESYAIIKSEDETLLMRVEQDGEEQYLVGINDQNKRDAILDAYEIAVNADPTDF